MSADELIALAGLNPNSWEVLAFAPEIEDKGAIGTFKHSGAAFAFIEERAMGPLLGAIARVSANPALAFGEIGREEQERLNAEANTPAGMDEPVGQEVAIAANNAARVGDGPVERIPAAEIEVLEPAAVNCPDCGLATGHTDLCMYAGSPFPEDLGETGGWG